MKKFFAILLIIILLYFIGSGLLSGLKLNKNNDISNKTGQVYLNRSANKNNPYNQEKTSFYGRETSIENNSANTVTAVIVDYRAMDTLGEVTVLFLAVTGVLALLGSKKEKRLKLEKPNFILQTSSHFLFPLIVTFGFYIFVHGHLTPGGGFQGGTIVAASILMMYFASNNFNVNKNRLKLLESFSGLSFIIVGLIGMIYLGDFLQNFLNLGTMGELFSAGIVPIIYILVGLKVSSELSSVVYEYMGDE